MVLSSALHLTKVSLRHSRCCEFSERCTHFVKFNLKRTFVKLQERKLFLQNVVRLRKDFMFSKCGLRWAAFAEYQIVISNVQLLQHFRSDKCCWNSQHMCLSLCISYFLQKILQIQKQKRNSLIRKLKRKSTCSEGLTVGISQELYVVLSLTYSHKHTHAHIDA